MAVAGGSAITVIFAGIAVERMLGSLTTRTPPPIGRSRLRGQNPHRGRHFHLCRLRRANRGWLSSNGRASLCPATDVSPIATGRSSKDRNTPALAVAPTATATRLMPAVRMKLGAGAR